jgi:hypothetical protein
MDDSIRSGLFPMVDFSIRGTGVMLRENYDSENLLLSAILILTDLYVLAYKMLTDFYMHFTAAAYYKPREIFFNSDCWMGDSNPAVVMDTCMRFTVLPCMCTGPEMRRSHTQQN